VIHLDTCLLIDLCRETVRDRPGPAFALLESLDEGETLAVSVHVLADLRAGAELSRTQTNGSLRRTDPCWPPWTGRAPQSR
jgi:hypothetical protein